MKERVLKPSKLPEAPPVPISPPALLVAPPVSSSRVPQYHYRSGAEDQKLTEELRSWLLEGKLTQTIPANILAPGAPIRKDLFEQLRTRRVRGVF